MLAAAAALAILRGHACRAFKPRAARPANLQTMNASTQHPRLVRHLLMVAGVGLFAVGFVGIFLPLLPTTVFWIGAAVCFSKSCPELEARILAHPRYGRPIRDFREHGVICRAGKRAALASMLISAVITTVLVHSDAVRLLVASILLAVAAYVATRPERALALESETG
jgi:uncharacterized membrane protein YbaN (DUF454 family)